MTRALAFAFSLALVFGGPTAHADSVTYTYDTHGRILTATTTSGATVTYAYDANGNRTQKVVTGGANTAPSAATDTKSTAKNVALGFDPRTNDSDANGDALTITAKTNGPNGATVAITGGGTGVTYTPATNYTGSDSFTYTISDGSLTAVGTVNVTVIANTAPVAVDDVDYVDHVPRGTPFINDYYVLSNDTDADGNSLTILSVTKVSGPATSSATVGGGGAFISATVGLAATGISVFDYVVSDGNGGTDTGTLTVQRVWNP